NGSCDDPPDRRPLFGLPTSGWYMKRNRGKKCLLCALHRALLYSPARFGRPRRWRDGGPAGVIATDLTISGPADQAGLPGGCSASAFKLASPASKSLPTIESMLRNRVITLNRNGRGPRMAHVTAVPAPWGSVVNSAKLCASNGFRKSS